MATVEPKAPLQPGDQAPDFTLPAVQREGPISLADYHGKSPVLLVINRGLWCSFCRRYIVQLASAWEKLRTVGVEMLVIVATKAERARQYIRFHPTPVPLAADPDYSTHRAYGLPAPPATAEIRRRWDSMRIRLDQIARNPTDLAQLTEAVRSVKGDPAADVREPVPIWDAATVQYHLYPFEITDSEEQDRQRNRAHSAGQFLVDREGIVRWLSVQATDGAPNSLGNLPTDEELLAAARALPLSAPAETGGHP